MPRPLDLSDDRLTLDDLVARVKDGWDYTVPKQIVGLLLGALSGAGLAADLVEESGLDDPQMVRYAPMMAGVVADCWYRAANRMLKEGTFWRGVDGAILDVVEDLKRAKAAGWEGVE
jgi:hypothetical protein